MRDIARMAGVSVQTVSRVINDSPDVSRMTRDKIQNLIEELGYSPVADDQSASAQGNLLGILIRNITDESFARMMLGAEEEARRQNHACLLSSVTVQRGRASFAYANTFIEHGVKGIILARPTIEMDTEHMLSLSRLGVPMVSMGGFRLAEARIPVVDVDNVKGGLLATKHLIEKGHQRIATITGPIRWFSARRRLAGYRQALEAARIPFNPTLVIEASDWAPEQGFAALDKLIKTGFPFSAIFCHSDTLAIGAIRALNDRELQAPGDVAVVGYDDALVARYYQPRLTTIAQPLEEVGAAACRKLLQVCEGQQVETETLLQPALVVREST